MYLSDSNHNYATEGDTESPGRQDFCRIMFWGEGLSRQYA